MTRTTSMMIWTTSMTMRMTGSDHHESIYCLSGILNIYAIVAVVFLVIIDLIIKAVALSVPVKSLSGAAHEKHQSDAILKNKGKSF